jgi:hypothetical protein
MTLKPRTATRAAALLSAAFLVLVGCVNVAPVPTPTAEPTSAPTATPTMVATPTLAPTPTVAPTPSLDPGESQGPETPPPSIDPALAEQIDRVVDQVPPIRQLQSTEDVPYQFISREQFRDELVELNDEDVPPEVRAAAERMLKRLGLLPDDADLDELLLELFGSQVAAYYRPDNGRFYIIERDQPFGPLDRIITAHEYTHALQDQHFDLEGTRISDPGEGDAALAQLAVIEGDATLTSQLWAIEHLTQAELFQLLTESLAGLDEETLAGMPLVLRRELEFPYTEGFVFVSEIYNLGGFEAVDQALATPPASTEQILHSDKYYAQEAPIEVSLDDTSAVLGPGWSLAYQQTLGELDIQIFVGGGEEPDFNLPGLPVEWPHAEVAAGWGGDRLHMYEHPDGRWAIVWQTAWDTEADAEEFETRVSELMGTFDGVAVVSAESSTGVTLLIADAQATLDALRRAP